VLVVKIFFLIYSLIFSFLFFVLEVGPQALGYALRPDAEQRLLDESGRHRLFKELLDGEKENASLADLRRENYRQPGLLCTSRNLAQI
jgi:hypothetical protein